MPRAGGWRSRRDLRRRALRGDPEASARVATMVLEHAKGDPGAPHVLLALRMRAAAHVLLGQAHLVVEDATRAIDEHELEPPTLFEILVMRAGAHLSLSEHALGAADLARATDVADPADAAHTVSLADLETSLHLAHRRLPEAWTSANRAVDAAPDRPGALACRAQVSAALGRTEDAEADLDRAIAATAPGDAAGLHLARVAVRLSSEDVDGAEAALAEALAAPPIPAHSGAVCAARGAVALARGDLSEAAAAAEAELAEADARSTGRWGHRGIGHRIRAEVRARTGDLDGALADADIAIAAAERSLSHLTGADAHRLRAAVRLQRGDLDGADADLAVAARLRDGLHDPTGARDDQVVAAELAAARASRDVR